MFRFKHKQEKLRLNVTDVSHQRRVHRSVAESVEFVPNYEDQVKDLQTIKKGINIK